VKERSLFLLLFEEELMSDYYFFQITHFSLKKRTIAHFHNEQMPNPEGWAIAHYLISALFKRAIEQSLAHLLF